MKNKKKYTYAWCFHPETDTAPIKVRYAKDGHRRFIEIVAFGALLGVNPVEIREVKLEKDTVFYKTLKAALQAKHTELYTQFRYLVAKTGEVSGAIDRVQDHINLID